LFITHLVVYIKLVVDRDLEARTIEDVQRLRQQWQLESGSGSQKNAATTSLSDAVLSGLKQQNPSANCRIRQDIFLGLSLTKEESENCSHLALSYHKCLRVQEKE
jgi:hypothetical protein